MIATANRFSVRVTARPDDIPVRGNAVVSDDPEADRQMENDILARLADGDVWAWCQVEIEVTDNDTGRTAREYLAGCNYADEQDFIENSGYYEDMVENCKRELQSLALDSFHTDLANLRKKYPMCYVEAWTPDDFAGYASGDPNAVDWSEPRWLDIASELEHGFDANQGTNWFRVEYAVNESGHGNGGEE